MDDARWQEELAEDCWVMLLEPDAQPLSNVDMLNHADDAHDVHMLRMIDEVVVHDVIVAMMHPSRKARCAMVSP